MAERKTPEDELQKNLNLVDKARKDGKPYWGNNPEKKEDNDGGDKNEDMSE